MIKIYLDSGADISFLKPYFDHCDFCTFPYDSKDRRKKAPIPLITHPSAGEFRDGNIRFDESDFTWDDFSASSLHFQLEQIVGRNNRRDVLHLDSAHKEKVHLFLTSDKGDIWSKRKTLEQVIDFKIYHTPSEKDEIIDTLISILTKSDHM